MKIEGVPKEVLLDLKILSLIKYKLSTFLFDVRFDPHYICHNNLSLKFETFGHAQRPSAQSKGSRLPNFRPNQGPKKSN
jgi:hypothetical protein